MVSKSKNFEKSGIFYGQKKAQMKIQQTAFLMVAITVLFVLVGMFFMITQLSGLKEKASEIREEKAIQMVSKLANSPEFSCGGAYGNERVNCIDWSKIMYLKNNSESFKEFYQVSGIVIEKLFPRDSEEIIECTRENYPDCNQITIFESETGRPAINFVSLCRKASSNSKNKDICVLARMTIYYQEAI